MQDLDEYLIPHAHDNLTALLEELNKPNLASFSFQNAFFYLYTALLKLRKSNRHV